MDDEANDDFRIIENIHPNPGCALITLEDHRCACDSLFPEVMQKVLAVKNTCPDMASSLIHFNEFRKRNLAISADYARIYLSENGEAQRLKFAAGAAFGSTHIGFAMDLAVETLLSWGKEVTSNPDIILSDGVMVANDSMPEIIDAAYDLQEGGSSVVTGVGYQETLIGLRRLVYGNLAIYMDLGAILHFCQMHEARFGYFEKGKVDEFIKCYEAFVKYVKTHHKDDHPVYAEGGSFGRDNERFVRDGLKAIANNDIEASLSIIDHEQRHILEQYMYKISTDEPTIPSNVLELLKPGREGDLDFKNFMNALEKTQFGDSYGNSPLFNGIRAQFSASKESCKVMVHEVVGNMMYRDEQTAPHNEQPLIFPFDRKQYGDNFSDPDVRVPWFKNIIRHYIKAENNKCSWPIDGTAFSASGQMVSQKFYWYCDGQKLSLAGFCPALSNVLKKGLHVIANGGSHKRYLKRYST